MTTQWSSPHYARIAELVRVESGLVFPDARVRDVEAAIRRAAARRGLDVSAVLLDWLQKDETAREALLAELTIGESYFMRDPAQFDLLRWRVLPELLRDCPPDRALRVWSAGCSSGEEPYSVAMLFDELNALDRADITGSDISRPRLEQAQRGLYSRWSLRSVSDRIRERYFRERGRFFELTPRIRRHVDFRYLNLAEDAFPSLSTGIWGMDVILCRNVLIYFDRDTVERVARRLLASLSENGWLILGASDPAIAELVECDVVLTDAGLAYRRVGVVSDHDIRRARPSPRTQTPAAHEQASAQEAAFAQREPAATVEPDALEYLAASSPEPVADPSAEAARASASAAGPADGILEAYASGEYRTVREYAEQAFGDGQLDERSAILWLRALANQGCLEDAARAAAVVQGRFGASPELLYVNAVVLLQMGRVEEAIGLSRRSLYMDRQLVVAHLTLAEALRRRGDVDAARRSLRNAASLLARMDRDQAVPASDGETAGRLAEMTRTRLALLGEAA
jgi:chemotaxis protein methyltransferase CheR